MSRSGAVLFLVVVFAMPAAAADMPSRKAGCGRSPPANVIDFAGLFYRF